MAVRIPESPRVIYASNPLTDVICQVRFPRILRIDTELPTAFQEAIRAVFPLFEVQNFDLVGIPVELRVHLHTPPSAFVFRSDDGAWAVTLTSEFLAFTTTQYRRWEEFKDRLELPLATLFSVYQPTVLARIGLRYVDVIRRSVLGLDATPWSELIKGWALGEQLELADEADVLGAGRDLLLQLDDGGRMRLQHGLVLRAGDPEMAYRFDTDFFVEHERVQPDPESVFAVLHRFNGLSGRLFRSLIETRLHEAMRPTEVQ